jgi:hypothetical protein
MPSNTTSLAKFLEIQPLHILKIAEIGLTVVFAQTPITTSHSV